FGVILAAILLAGRTASAFTAQIGSMKANEELDALRTLGLSPMELLVVPRVLALLITLPLLTFVAIISGLTGGALVALVSLDIP
ncbi:ABC transporter permease, partial [Klebsiella pneumoniae]